MEHHPEGLMLEATTYSALMHTIQNDVRVSHTVRLVPRPAPGLCPVHLVPCLVFRVSCLDVPRVSNLLCRVPCLVFRVSCLDVSRVSRLLCRVLCICLVS